MEQLAQRFLDYLRHERRRSECTVFNYGEDLKHFMLFVGELDAELGWESIDSDIIRNWVEAMVDGGNKPASVNRRLSCLRTFYKYALARGLLQTDPTRTIKGLKKSKLLPQYLREEEMDRLLQDEYWGESYEELLARTIILLFYSTGIRVSELTGLDDASVNYSDSSLKVRGKRDKERIIPFGTELAQALRLYQSRRDKETARRSNALLVDDKGRRMNNKRVQAMVRQNLSKVTTMKKRSPHVLRHTFATAMLNNGSDLVSIQKLLGHESVATTEIYTHTTFEQLKRAYANAHPRENED